MNRLLKILCAVAVLIAIPAMAAGKPRRSADAGGVTQKSIQVDPAVSVSICVDSANVTVYGWNRNEVRARSDEGGAVEFRRVEPSGTPAGPPPAPARRIEVIVTEEEQGRRRPWSGAECSATTDATLYVPKGATVIVRTQGGDVQVEEVAVVRADTSSGAIDIRGATREVEAFSFSGEISASDCTGAVKMRSVSGSIDALNLSPGSASDSVSLSSTSGDVVLSRVRHKNISAASTAGSLEFTGDLAPLGNYMFRSTSGDVTFVIPETSTFRLSAMVARSVGEIICQFQLRPELRATQGSRDRSTSWNVTGWHGSEKPAEVASVNLATFSGTIRVVKK